MLNIKDQSQGHQRGGGAGKGPIGQTDKQTNRQLPTGLSDARDQ